MALWPSRRRRERAAAQAAERERAEQAAARQRILDEAERQRQERDARWNQATRWHNPSPLTIGQRTGYQPAAAVALARTGRHWLW